MFQTNRNNMSKEISDNRFAIQEDDLDTSWIVEQKKLFGWSEIGCNEGPRYRCITHNSYEEAELYLLNNYTGHGVCRRYGNIYTFKHYTYYM